jgi:hypothetical protein
MDKSPLHLSTFFFVFLLIRIVNNPRKSELVQLKLNIDASDGDSTPPEVTKNPPPLIEVGVMKT